MPDYDDRDDDRTSRRDDRFDDSRGDRFDDRPPPKKKSGTLKVVLVILGVVGVLCAGACGVFGWWAYSLGTGGQKAAEGVLAQVGGGDLAGAYNSMSATFKATTTREQFESRMRAAKLTDFSSVTWTGTQQNNQALSLTGTATLKSGGSTPVTVKVKLLPDLKTWEIDDVSGGAGGPEPKGEPKGQ